MAAARVAVVGVIAVGVVAAGVGVAAGPAGAIEVNFGRSNKLDMGKLRSAIESNAKKAYAGFTVGKATCPKERTLKAGDKFSCSIPVADGVLTVDITQKDTKGNVNFVARQAIIDLAKARAFITTQVQQQTKVKPVVDCGKGAVRVIEPKKALTCTAADESGEKITVKLTVQDIDGNVVLTTV
jgi:hypothetical protein